MDHSYMAAMEEMDSLSDSSSIGEAVSGRGRRRRESDEDDGIFYIPERRRSLHLDQTPMDTSHWQYVEQAFSPALSYRSMTSEENLSNMDGEEGSPTRLQLRRADSYSSCYSLDSDDCEKIIPKVKNKDETATEVSDTPVLKHNPNEFKHPALTVEFTFKAICEILRELSEDHLLFFKVMLWKRYPQSFNTPPQSLDLVDLVDRLLECYNLEVSLQITKTLLESLKERRLVKLLQSLCLRNEVRYELCKTLKKTYGEIDDDSATQGERRPLDDFFTKLDITSIANNGPNVEHEVRTIDRLDTNSSKPVEQISTKDLMSAERLEKSNVKLALITGVAGSGKSMAIKKLILDWIEGRSHKHVAFMFPLPFRELNKFKGSEVSLLQIIQTLYPETKKLRDYDYTCDKCRVMLIFDGLEEYNEPFNFQNTSLLTDHTVISTLHTIVVNMLRARLLHRGIYLVFSRPRIRSCIPYDTSYDEIELRGFSDPEKDEYFKKRFPNPDQAARVIEYTHSSKTLRIMCHLPLFCSLVADEYQCIFKEQGLQAQLPRSITYMYTKLLLALIGQRRTLGASPWGPDNGGDFLMVLGKLAYNMLEKGTLKLNRYEWEAHELDNEEAVNNSGLCMVFVTKPHLFSHEKVLSFIHPTMQEYLAALYVFLSFRNQGKNLFEPPLKEKFKGYFKGQKPMELYKSAVDKSLQYDDGKLDIFLRFLLGTTLKANLDLLQPFCTPSPKWQSVAEDAAALIKKRIKDNQYPNRIGNLKCCLEELDV
ncbi:hypothetical protein KUCAC02_002905 [Chaenocephalus aceratus]|uniref:Uncharacterized protein n=1 Tax=Chaenocephalus aceratus TaxID=36190 RepID=A0ACB9WKJ9_CHAAC|nr:hypothetical protein KUCAC02_002905 [Chaenocephalus aceratus]